MGSAGVQLSRALMAGRKQGVEGAVRAEKTLGVVSPGSSFCNSDQATASLSEPFPGLPSSSPGNCTSPLPFLRTLCQRSLPWTPPPILPNSLCSLIFSPNFSPSDILCVSPPDKL